MATGAVRSVVVTPRSSAFQSPGSYEVLDYTKAKTFYFLTYFYMAKANAETKSIVVRLRDATHPSGQRNRAGFTFTKDPVRIDVNREQYAAIKADACLVITSKEQDLAAATEQDNEDVTGDEEAVKEDVKKETPTEKLSRAELVEKLKEKGFEEGKDFDKKATIADLSALLDA